LKRRPIWLTKNLPLDTIRKEVETMELQAEQFYIKADREGPRMSACPAARRSRRRRKGPRKARGQTYRRNPQARRARRGRPDAASMFVLQYVQPGLPGLMDGSVSTLAPLFAAAFATHQNWQTFLVGLAASIGAGISMGFAEALSDDGTLTGRGSPWLRGLTCGLMTTLGASGTRCPISCRIHGPTRSGSRPRSPAFVGVLRIVAIAFIRAKYMDTPFLQAVFQIVRGGVIVLGVGILIGAA